ncbi:DUF4199 domain-containing protein [Sediminitomix flava]|uniref:Uncharacterized protein DUF4199 n=1 Tax=Sediminitomix flava TaxID=379075 RepID=A0A315Z6P8_SEDFL|nr:DUF4199 domain-containing protein [Sediminitomix flava]PWJ39382.1 uncharacterized protein DUF4199 [Sediminitomix flava]
MLKGTYVSTKPIALKYGGVLGLGLFGYTTALLMLGIASPSAMMAIYLFLSVAIIFAVRDYRNWNNGVVTFQKGFTLGLLTSLIAGVIYGLLRAFYFKFIDDSVVQQGIQDMTTLLNSAPDMTAEEVEQSIEMLNWAANSFLAQASMQTLDICFMGLFFSFTTAFFFRTVR